MRFKAILAMVNEKYQDDVIESAKTAGSLSEIIFGADHGISKGYAPFLG